MLRYIIEVSLCWSVFYLVYHLWLRRETFFSANRWYLLGALLFGVCIPLLELPSLTTSPQTPLAVVYQAPVIIGAEWMEVTVRPEEAPGRSFAGWQMTAVIYWLGFAIALLRFLLGLVQIHRLYREAEVIERPGFKLVRTRRPHLPFSFFNLLFQSREVSLDWEEEEQIHRHELAHIKGRHSLDVLLVEIIGIALWCSPPIYLYRRSIRDVHEFLADAAVLKTTRRTQYSKLLLRQFQSGLQLALANHFIRSQFKNRIIMMTKKRSRHGALLKYLLILPALITAIFLFAKRDALTGEFHGSSEQPAPFSTTTATIEGDSILTQAEVMPRFPGCEELETEAERQQCAQKQFLKHVYTSIFYPAEARKAGIQGTVIVRFTIDEEGHVRHPEVVKTPGGGLGEEVLRVLRTMPQWIPGRDKGKAVAVQMTLPVKFGLENDRETKEPAADQYDVMPVFAGCEELTDPAEIKLCTAKKMTQFMSENLKYPKEAEELGIEGKVFVQLTIDETGKIGQVEIKRGVESRLNEEALRVVWQMPRWKPAQKDGKAVSAQLTLPIHFDLPIKHDAVVIGYKTEEKPDQPPRFPGCEEESDEEAKAECARKQFMTYIFNNLQYPLAAKDNKVEGLVIASYVVDAEGRIGEVEIVRSLGHGTDEEVKRVLLSMNDLPEKWVPGRTEGKAIATKMTLPVKFALPKEEPAKDVASLPLELKAFSLSPNPNNGQFQLTFEAEARPTYLRVADAAGKVVLEEKLNDFDGRYRGEIDLAQKAKGTYFLTVIQEGKGPFNHAFIVQ